MQDLLRIVGLTGALAAACVLGAEQAMARDHGRAAALEKFEEADLNGDGQVTAAELEEARAARFAAIDGNGDGQVDRAEFLAHALAEAEARAGRMFDRLDADGDGMLGEDVLARSRGRGPGAGMLRRLDADGDGAVTRAELEAGLDRFAERRGHGRHGRRDP